MYATTYEFDENDVEVLVEIVVVDDLIFYSQGDYHIWYMTSSCTLYPRPVLNVITHDLSDVISMGRKEWVLSHEWRRMPSRLQSILHDIYKIYSSETEERYFQLHQLDDRWDAIANSIREQLY